MNDRDERTMRQMRGKKVPLYTSNFHGWRIWGRSTRHPSGQTTGATMRRTE